LLTPRNLVVSARVQLLFDFAPRHRGAEATAHTFPTRAPARAMTREEDG